MKSSHQVNNASTFIFVSFLIEIPLELNIKLSMDGQAKCIHANFLSFCREAEVCKEVSCEDFNIDVSIIHHTTVAWKLRRNQTEAFSFCFFFVFFSFNLRYCGVTWSQKA